MATFLDADGTYRFKFINHTKHTAIHYELGPATDGQSKEHEKVKAGDQGGTGNFTYAGAPIEKGNVHVIKIHDAPEPGFRFWSGDDGQYVNVLA